MEPPEHIITIVSSALNALNREKEQRNSQGVEDQTDLRTITPEIEQLQGMLDESKNEKSEFEVHEGP
jgi:hypothetical protein